MKKKYVICTFVDSFEFPLREALRKQVWWRAKEKQKDYEVEIIVYNHNTTKSIVKDDIKISFINKNEISQYKIVADYIDYITTIVELRSIFALKAKGYKTLTLCDGYPLGENKILLRKVIIQLLPYIFKKIYVFSNYQKKVLNLEQIELIKPLLPTIIKKNIEKYKEPTLLYMGHLSYFKGVDTLIEAYKILKNDIGNLNLIIANNMVRGDKKLLEEVQNLQQQFPENVSIKGVIDPIEELSKAWIYIYPFIKPGGTMSFALSLYESQQCNTPFIACDIGANAEFFGKTSLIKPHSIENMVQKVKEIMKNEYE